MEGFDYLIYTNQTSNVTLKNTLDFNKSKNVELIEPYQGIKVSFTVNPGETLVVPIL